jgi:hypothetical protein
VAERDAHRDAEANPQGQVALERRQSRPPGGPGPPEGSGGRQERAQRVERRGIEGIADPRPLDLSGDDARRVEDPQVLGDRRLRQADLVDEVAADALIVVRRYAIP